MFLTLPRASNPRDCCRGAPSPPGLWPHRLAFLWGFAHKACSLQLCPPRVLHCRGWALLGFHHLRLDNPGLGNTGIDPPGAWKSTGLGYLQGLHPLGTSPKFAPNQDFHLRVFPPRPGLFQNKVEKQWWSIFLYETILNRKCIRQIVYLCRLYVLGLRTYTMNDWRYLNFSSSPHKTTFCSYSLNFLLQLSEGVSLRSPCLLLM
jgi:hypothetical protein